MWLNGRWVGRHDSCFTSFDMDVTGLVSDTAVNTLAVCVRQVCTDYKCDTYDDWTLGGIFRDVIIKAMPRKCWIDKVLVRMSLSNVYRDADVEVDAFIADAMKKNVPGNYSGTGRPYQLTVELRDKDGRAVLQ